MPTQWRSIYSNTSRWRCVCIIDRNTIRLPQQVKVNTFVYTEEAVKQLIDINSARAPCTHICTCSFITLQQFHAQALCRSLPLRFISHIFQRWMKRSKVTWPFLFPASFPHHLCRASEIIREEVTEYNCDCLIRHFPHYDLKLTKHPTK